jgi:HTH-type transcriptional repressor of NAD biosynthesis genes
MMHNGLILGKFLPFHKGHEALINFGLSICEHLTVAVVSKRDEVIPMEIRLGWLKDHFAACTITITPFYHDLPHDGKFTEADRLLWCEAIKTRFPKIDVLISSESYGHNLAEYMGIEHREFDAKRTAIPVSATAIRNNPMAYREYLPKEVQLYYGVYKQENESCQK